MKIELPNEYNTRALKREINKVYPELDYSIQPARMIVEGAGDGKLVPAQIRVKGNISKDLKAELEMFVNQALFDLATEKTDAQEKQEEELKNLLSGGAFVYILKELEDLRKEIKKLKKETTPKENKKDETIEIQPPTDEQPI